LVNQTVTWTATPSGGNGTGSYSYDATGSTACSVDAASGAITITGASGSCIITATKMADSNYLASAASSAASVTVTAAASDGILDPDNTTGRPGLKDALMALGFAMGEAIPTPGQLRRGDTSPMINGVPHPDGKIDLGDVLVILRKAVGLVR
jgi:hypothetical protein